jgi:hypothetical protein
MFAFALLPAFNHLVTMSKFLCLGMELIDAIRASTAAPERRSAAPISEDCKSARSATRPYSNSPRAISNTAMSLARLARDGNGSKRADLWWPGAGGTRRGHERKVSACV